MKSVIVSKEIRVEEKPFPKLMESLFSVALFTEKGKGICIHKKGSGGFSVGDYVEVSGDSFKEFTGTIQLSND